MATESQTAYIISLLDRGGYNLRRTNAAYQRLGATGAWRRGQDPRDWVRSLSATQASEVIDTLLSETAAEQAAPEQAAEQAAPEQAAERGTDGGAPLRLGEIMNLWEDAATRGLLDLIEIRREDVAAGDVFVWDLDDEDRLVKGWRDMDGGWQGSSPSYGYRGRIWRLALRTDVTPQEARHRYREAVRRHVARREARRDGAAATRRAGASQAGERLDYMLALRCAVTDERAAREEAEAARERMRQAALDAVGSGASIAEVARLVGVPRSTLYRWRSGHHTVRGGA